MLGSTAKKIKVLIVDDEEQWLRLLRIAFQRKPTKDWDIKQKNSYEEVHELLNDGNSNFAFDLAIFNQNLANKGPGLDSEKIDDLGGSALFEELMAKFPNINVKRVLLTSSKTCDDYNEGLKGAGIIDDVFPKIPFNAEVFVKKIVKLMECQHANEKEGILMPNLKYEDRNELVKQLTGLSQWKDGGVVGEKSVLRLAGLPATWINNLYLSGATEPDAVTVVDSLERIGHLPDRPGYRALGALVGHLLEKSRELDKDGMVFYAKLIKEYKLIADSVVIEKYPHVELIKFINETIPADEQKQPLYEDIFTVMKSDDKQSAFSRIKEFLLAHEDDVKKWAGIITKASLAIILAKFGLKLSDIGLD